MRRVIVIIILLIFAFGTLLSAQAQEEDDIQQIEIIKPLAGEAVQGTVLLIGTTAVDGMEAWSISFAYVGDETKTWFLINEGTEALDDDILAEWDTTTITDGIYDLKLYLDLDKGLETELIVPDIRIRNYSPIETSTPTITPTINPDSLSATPTLTATPYPSTPTPLPTNAIDISTTDITDNLTRGALISLVLFLLMGLYFSIRRTLR